MTVLLRNMLPRAAAESGSEGMVEKTNLAMEAQSAELLDQMGGRSPPWHVVPSPTRSSSCFGCLCLTTSRVRSSK